MASRRVRIKGIANIPQRRKPVTESDGNANEHQEQKNTDGNKSQEIIENPNLTAASESHGATYDATENTNDKACEDSPAGNTPADIVTTNIAANNHELIGNKIAEISSTTLSSITENSVNIIEKKDIENDASTDTPSNTKKALIETKPHIDKVPSVRRKFLKPPVCINLVNRKVKENLEEIKVEPNKENVQESVNFNLNEVEISANTNSSLVIQKAEPVEYVAPKLDTGNIPPKESVKPNLDIEYQQPPASPTKILNRRIKAIPKLHQRRTSFSIGSASESEDDTRRSYSRIRNDSVCSTASGINECPAVNEAMSPVRKEFQTVQRKSRKTEQTRKFAEARREFNMKFNNGKPDKQKLTMIDLIFYNPATSPMSYNKRKHKNTTSSEISEKSVQDNKINEEQQVDDPQMLSESDNEVPAPQIKVGPNGEIVVDEKSLIIENAETKRSREALQMSELVNGDDDTSYGIYKRIKRSKDWSKDETLRFYKALNTIGTDFTMMCELFPNRTRRELKMKFKKEEKLNQALIDKALMQPIEFDMTDLRKDLEFQERKEEEIKKRAEETKLMKAAISEHRKHMKRNEKLKGIDKTTSDDSTRLTTKKVKKKKKKTPLDAIKRGINGVLSDSDEDDISESPVNDNSNDSYESNENYDKTDVCNILKPTRYGRIPKTRVLDAPNGADALVEHIAKRRKLSVDDRNDLEPGSIMIVKSKTPSDKVVYKVYIVTDNQTKQQIKLDPNLLQNLTSEGIDKLNNDNGVCDVQAHNIFTISAQECSDSVDRETTSVPSETSNTNIQELKDSICDVSKLPMTNFDNCVNEIKVSADSIIFPFAECQMPTIPHQNITVSHEENKMIVVTEDNKKCVLTT